MATHIIAVDPGKTTGIATYDLATKKLDTQECDFDATCRYVLGQAASLGGNLLLVSESFTITMQTAKNSQAPWSLELIGVMRYASRMYCARDLALQMPSAAKRFSSDRRLRELEFWTPAKGHANDASRHMLLFLAERGLIDKEILRKLVDIT